MAVRAKSSTSLPIEEGDFHYLILNKIFYLVPFSCINYPLVRNIKLKILLLTRRFGTSLLLNKLFSNFKLQRHGRILLRYFKQRIRTNDKIVNIVFC